MIVECNADPGVIKERKQVKKLFHDLVVNLEMP